MVRTSPGHDKEGWNEVISCQIQRRDTKQNLQPQIVFIPGSSMAGSLPLGGDRRYFNGNNFNSTSDLGFVAMTGQWSPGPTQGLALSHHGLSPSCDTVSVNFYFAPT